MITKMKIFEKMVKFDDNLGLGLELFEGMVGILIDHEEYEEMIPMMKFLQHTINVKFRFLITNRICLLLFEDDDARELPSLNGSHEITNHYVPMNGMRHIGWFYQDIIDEDDWEEVIIENVDDVKELGEKMKMYSQSNKYNL